MYNKEYQHEYFKKNRERIKAQRRIWYANLTPEKKFKHVAQIKRAQELRYSSPQKRLLRLLHGAKYRARDRKFAFDIGLFSKYLTNPPVNCMCCHRELNYGRPFGHKDPRRACPSIDRFNNSLGYTLDNTRIICHLCNRLKNDATLQELENVVAYMKNLTFV